MIRLITAGDRKVMLRLNQWAAPRWIREWMLLATRAGDGWLWIALGRAASVGGRRSGVSMRWARLSRSADRRAVVVFRAETVDRAGAPLRHRTALLGATAAARPLLFSLRPYDYRFRDCGAHRSVLLRILLLAGLIFCALSIASSRVLLGLHYLSDVLAGIVIGCAIGHRTRFRCWVPVYNSRMGDLRNANASRQRCFACCCAHASHGQRK